MKRVFALVLAVLMMVSLCACGGGSSSSETAESSERDKVTSAVRGRAVAAMLVEYETSGSPQVTMASVREKSNHEWEVSGKITVKDKYGDTYTCNYDAKVKYDPELDKANVTDFEHTTPRKG